MKELDMVIMDDSYDVKAPAQGDAKDLRAHQWSVSINWLRKSIASKTARISRRQRLFAQILTVLLILFLFFQPQDPRSKTGTLPQRQTPYVSLNTTSASPSLNRQFFHLVVPANQRDPELCKTLLSAAVLNYSTPTLVNWDDEFTNPGLSSGGSHLAKISGIAKYLNGIGEANDGDLVLVIDGLDIWFQLPPDVLLTRYSRFIHQATRRASQRLCGRDDCYSEAAFAHIRPRIVFSTQKVCLMHSHDELGCYGSPPSTLPPNAYGPDTDKSFPDQDNEVLRHRQRYMNSGWIFGPVRDMRKMFNEAERRSKFDEHRGSDQAIFGDILGAQEYAREVLRANRLTKRPFQRFLYRFNSLLFGKSEFDKDRDMILQPDHAREVLRLDTNNHTAVKQYEYGIALDYESVFSHTTVYAERDADWAIHAQPNLPSRYWNIKSPVIDMKTVPDDILRVPVPFRNLLAKTTAPFATSWYTLPLYTHLFTGHIPVAVHHNAWRNGNKALREKQWGQMWWNPIAKPMFRAHISDQTSPIVDDEMLGQWWNPVENRGGARADSGTWISWEVLCGNFESFLNHTVRQSTQGPFR